MGKVTKINKKKKEEETKETPETGFIKITNSYLRRIITVNQVTNQPIDPVVLAVQQRDKPFKAEYWITRAFDKMHQEAKSFQKEHQTISEKYADKIGGDGEDADQCKKDEQGQFTYTPENQTALNEEYMEFLETEIEIPMKPIEINMDDPGMPKFNTEEMMVLIPIMKEIEQ